MRAVIACCGLLLSTVLVAQESHQLPLLLRDLTWTDEEPLRLEAKLEKEAVLEGEVLDGETGKPVMDAKVQVVSRQGGDPYPNYFYSRGNVSKGQETRTDKEGKFRIDSLAKGKIELSVSHSERPSPKPMKLELATAEHRQGLQLSMNRGYKFTGRFSGFVPQPGYHARLTPRDSSSSTPRHQLLAELGADASYAFEGLAAGGYDLHLVMLRAPRNGGTVSFSVEPLRIREQELQRDCDASTDQPAVLTGKVVCSGAAIPLDQLLVIASRNFAAWDAYQGYRVNGPYYVPGRDGQFEFVLRPGTYRLQVLDMATGILLHQAEDGLDLEVGDSKNLDLSLSLTTVKVHLRPAEEGAEMARAERLEVQVESPKAEEWKALGISSSQSRIKGPRLSPGQEDVLLTLPAQPTKFILRSSVSQIVVKKEERKGQVLVEAELTPELGKVNAVELAVPPPPKLTDPDEKKVKPNPDEEAAAKEALDQPAPE